MTIAGLPAATEVGRKELPDDASRRSQRQWRGPWRPPWFLATLTWGYIVWTLLPVLIAIQFSFNAGRSRSVWQGFSFRWYWQDPVGSVWHDPSMLLALRNSIIASAESRRRCIRGTLPGRRGSSDQFPAVLL